MHTATSQPKDSSTQPGRRRFTASRAGVRAMVSTFAFFIATLATVPGALAKTITTPALLFDGHMNCLIVNAGTEPLVVQSWSLVGGFTDSPVTWGGRLAPFTLPPGGVESIDTVNDGGGALFCQVNIAGSTKNARVSIISRNQSTMQQTGVAQGY